MKRSYSNMKIAVPALVILLLCSKRLVAQDSSSTRQEVWPELNVFYQVNNRFRVYALYSATKLKNSSYTDGGIGIYVDYFAFPTPIIKKLGHDLRDSTSGYYVWFRVGYLYSAAPPESADPFKENTFVTEANLRFHLPQRILLTNKNRFDWRSIDGNFEPRYRPRLTFERNMHTKYLSYTPTIYGEYYFYLGRGGFNRFRISAGIQVKVTEHAEIETYYVQQFDNGKNVRGLKAMGFALKFYFRHKEVKKILSKSDG